MGDMRMRIFVLLAAVLTTVSASAQTTVSLSSSTNREVWVGETAGSSFGASLDRGELNQAGRRDLIIGAPGWNSNEGRVYIHFSGPVRGGQVAAGTTAT